MEAKHTPGPWFAVDYSGSYFIQNGPMYEDKGILSYDYSTFGEKYSVTKEEAEANAALIIAAPEMFEACLSAKAMYEAQGINEHSRIGGEQYKQLLQAIEKATEKNK